MSVKRPRTPPRTPPRIPPRTPPRTAKRVRVNPYWPRLDFYYENMHEIDQIPPHVTELSVVNCPNITKLPRLPAGLRELTLQNLPSLTAIPDIPESVRSLCLEALPAVKSTGVTRAPTPEWLRTDCGRETQGIYARAELYKTQKSFPVDVLSIIEAYAYDDNSDEEWSDSDVPFIYNPSPSND